MDIDQELEKLRVAEEAGADAIMDLSTGGDLDRIRKDSDVPRPRAYRHRPHYQAAVEAVRRKKSITRLEADELFDVIEKHGEDGCRFCHGPLRV